MKGRTVIIIAHRLSTVEKADRIIVIDKGRVIEEGPHRQLLESKGIYSKLVKRQMLLSESSWSNIDSSSGPLKRNRGQEGSGCECKMAATGTSRDIAGAREMVSNSAMFHGLHRTHDRKHFTVGSI